MVITPLSRAIACIGAILCGLGQLAEVGAADKPRVTIEFRRAESSPAKGLLEATIVGSDEKVYLYPMAELTNKDVAKARIGLSESKEPELLLTFTQEGAKKMGKLTEEHKGKPLAILINGKVVVAPVLRSKITEYASVRGKFTEAEVHGWAQAINGK